MEEGVGFEPTDHFTMINGLASRPNRPLWHPSKMAENKGLEPLSPYGPPVFKTGLLPIRVILHEMAPPVGIEPTAPTLTASCSTRLSYRGIYYLNLIFDSLIIPLIKIKGTTTSSTSGTIYSTQSSGICIIMKSSNS